MACDGGHTLSYIETIAGGTEFTGNLGARALAGIEQLHGLSFELEGKSSTLGHLVPSCVRSCSLLECPSNPRQLKVILELARLSLFGPGDHPSTQYI